MIPTVNKLSWLRLIDRLFRGIWSPWWSTGKEFCAALEDVLTARHPGLLSLGLLLAATIAFWFVYVPIHELLHAFGCVATGGRVIELQISRLYAGQLLEKVFPFVRAGGEYAGRLTRFETHGSDLVYLATDFAPFILTLLGASPLLRAARRRRSIVLMAPGTVLAAAPLVSLGGDLYEIGSILVSNTLRRLGAGAGNTGLAALRYDDLFRLFGEFKTRFPQDRPAWAMAVVASALLGWVAGGAILAASRRWADLLSARSPLFHRPHSA